jgi:hypothetical protein
LFLTLRFTDLRFFFFLAITSVEFDSPISNENEEAGATKEIIKPKRINRNLFIVK